MRRALIIGGTGLIGRAVATRLLAADWRVDLMGRDASHMPQELAAAGARFLPGDRDDPVRLREVFGTGADLVVDCVCFTAEHARGLLPIALDAGSTVMISSKAVYVDGTGNHVNSSTPPRFDGPIRESQPTLPAGDGDYMTATGYGANKVAAERILLDSGFPVTVIRASKIHGPHTTQPREWVFVKRCLDRRPAVLLARRGAGVDHTTAVANLASLVETIADRPGTRILNCADPDAPSALKISRTIAGLIGHSWEEVLLDEGTDPALGRHPWDAAHPLILDTSAASELGYRPVGDYATTVKETVDWLVASARAGDGGVRLDGGHDQAYTAMFDYPAEDRFLATR